MRLSNTVLIVDDPALVKPESFGRSFDNTYEGRALHHLTTEVFTTIKAHCKGISLSELPGDAWSLIRILKKLHVVFELNNVFDSLHFHQPL